MKDMNSFFLSLLSDFPSVFPSAKQRAPIRQPR